MNLCNSVMWILILIRSDPHSFGFVDPDKNPEVLNEGKNRVQPPKVYITFFCKTEPKKVADP